MNKKTKQFLQTLLFFGIGIVLVYFQVKGLSQEERDAVVTSIQQANFLWIFLAAFVGVFSHYIRGIRWKMIIDSTGDTVSALNSFYAVMIGYLANGFLPRFGEVIRCGVLGRKENIKVEKLIGTVVVERLFDLIVLILVVGTTLLVQYQLLFDFINEKLFRPFAETFSTGLTDLLIKLSVVVVVFVAILTLLFFISKKIGIWQKIKTKWDSVRHSFTEGFSAILKVKNKGLFVFYSLFIWVCYFLMAYLIFFALDDTKHLGFEAGLSVLTSGSLALLIPTPGGLGSYHQFVSNTLQLYNIPDTAGISLSWLIWSTNFAVILVFGLLSLLLISIKKK